MIFLCNVFITDEKFSKNSPYNRGNLNSQLNFDIFKYSISSLSKIYKWKKVIFKIKLDKNYEFRKEELFNFIKSEFTETEIHLDWNRNEYQKDWIETYDLINDRLIWFYCNHDHIFLDSNSFYLNQLVEIMRNEDKEYLSLVFSHWPECIRNIKLGLDALAHGGLFNPDRLSREYKIEDNFISNMSSPIDSIQIITKELYKSWWFDGNFQNVFLPRPDFFEVNLMHIKRLKWHKVMYPLKELCRHFDGYNHVSISNNKCPALDIPNGFFENNIQINYGSDLHDSNFVNFNPTNKNYFAYEKTGTDYKWNLEDIPLFWKTKIKNINNNSTLDKSELINYRLTSILDSIIYEGYPVDEEVQHKIIELYLKEYKDYERQT